MEPLTLVELDGKGPRYGQITRALIAAVMSGTLPPGARLPTTRDLAKQLGCSRNVVLLAYEQLVLEGYFHARPRAGTFVSTELPRPPVLDRPRPSAEARLAVLAPAGRRLAEVSEQAHAITRRTRSYAIDFMYGFCEPDPRVVGQLKTAFSRALGTPGVFSYGDPAGDEHLRGEIARRLHAARGIARSADQILITNGTQQALDICARLLLRAGDVALLEDPGYEVARAAFRAAGATVVPVRVDADGLDPAALLRASAKTRLLYVTPSHQFPTGAVLPVARRHSLRAWAHARGVYVIEDDYDGELRYHSRPTKALAGLEPDDDVIYCGTFAKSLFASVRLAYVALPASLMHAAVRAKWLSDRGSSKLLQCLVTELMTTGAYDRFIRRMQRRYTSRRAALIRALTQHLGSDVAIAGDAAGMHLVAWFPHLSATEIDALIARCRQADVGVYSIASHAVLPMTRQGLIMGYGLVDERAIEAGVSVIASAYREVKQGGRKRAASARVTTVDA